MVQVFKVTVNAKLRYRLANGRCRGTREVDLVWCNDKQSVGLEFGSECSARFSEKLTENSKNNISEGLLQWSVH
jgi:hypothetical protein